MPTDISLQDIQNLVNESEVTGFTGQYITLGSGEGNDTFVLDCGETRLVLRVAKYSDVANLAHEARALGLLHLEQVPKLIYFDEARSIIGRAWILESYMGGKQVGGLSLQQFENLGRLLAHVHSVRSDDMLELDFWQEFLGASKRFGDEQTFLNHPDDMLKRLANRARDYFQSQKLYAIAPSLTHGDVSLSNMLVNSDMVSLIDWEFSRFTDPVADFSTVFYEDMAYNRGKWRIHITRQEKTALFAGYTDAGGVVDEQRLKAWHKFDKLGGAMYLYWKLNHSGHAVTPAHAAQYKEDLYKLSTSLDRSL